jgi:hypothetical protein
MNVMTIEQTINLAVRPPARSAADGQETIAAGIKPRHFSIRTRIEVLYAADHDGHVDARRFSRHGRGNNCCQYGSQPQHAATVHDQPSWRQ